VEDVDHGPCHHRAPATEAGAKAAELGRKAWKK
jgi:hypothetical protein